MFVVGDCLAMKSRVTPLCRRGTVWTGMRPPPGVVFVTPPGKARPTTFTLSALRAGCATAPFPWMVFETFLSVVGAASAVELMQKVANTAGTKCREDMTVPQ
ncbi:hypothetical protein KBA01_24530 [Kozakia baliensis]|nr:hypothetical protein KBA01_24530 [Kozakia baliensis]